MKRQVSLSPALVRRCARRSRSLADVLDIEHHKELLGEAVKMSCRVFSMLNFFPCMSGDGVSTRFDKFLHGLSIVSPMLPSGPMHFYEQFWLVSRKGVARSLNDRKLSTLGVDLNELRDWRS